jgi:hypothetical protein
MPDSPDPQDPQPQPRNEGSNVPAKREEEKREEEQLEAIIDKLPPDQVQHTLREVIFGIIERGSAGPKIDPEVMRIAAATVEKDNENKFKYLTQKQSDEAAKSIRDDEFRTVRHGDQIKLFWPILITVLVAIVGCIVAGIYLAVNGHEPLGIGLITGAAFSVLGYLAGAGTSDIFKGVFSSK